MNKGNVPVTTGGGVATPVAANVAGIPQPVSLQTSGILANPLLSAATEISANSVGPRPSREPAISSSQPVTTFTLHAPPQSLQNVPSLASSASGALQLPTVQANPSVMHPSSITLTASSVTPTVALPSTGPQMTSISLGVAGSTVSVLKAQPSSMATLPIAQRFQATNAPATLFIHQDAMAKSQTHGGSHVHRVGAHVAASSVINTAGPSASVHQPIQAHPSIFIQTNNQAAAINAGLSSQSQPTLTQPPPPPPPAQLQSQQPQFQRLKVEDALTYLDQVKFKFNDHPTVYNDFLDIMKEFKSQSIDTPGVIERVSLLFEGHPELIVGFNTFLPPGYKIELNANDEVNLSMPNSANILLLPYGSKKDRGGTTATPVMPAASVVPIPASVDATSVNIRKQVSLTKNGAQTSTSVFPPSTSTSVVSETRATKSRSRSKSARSNTRPTSTMEPPHKRPALQASIPALSPLTPILTATTLPPKAAATLAPGPVQVPVSTPVSVAVAVSASVQIPTQTAVQILATSQVPTQTVITTAATITTPLSVPVSKIAITAASISNQQTAVLAPVTTTIPLQALKLASISAAKVASTAAPSLMMMAAVTQAATSSVSLHQSGQSQPPAGQLATGGGGGGIATNNSATGSLKNNSSLIGLSRESSNNAVVITHHKPTESVSSKSCESGPVAHHILVPAAVVSHPSEVKSRSSQGPMANSSGAQPVEFNHAINYVNKIKSRFQHQPEVYKQFLDILQTYQKEQRLLNDGVPSSQKLTTENEVFSKVAKLFQQQDDLLAEFSQFLPVTNSCLSSHTTPARPDAVPSKVVSTVNISANAVNLVQPVQSGNQQPTSAASIVPKHESGTITGSGSNSLTGVLNAHSNQSGHTSPISHPTVEVSSSSIIKKIPPVVNSSGLHTNRLASASTVPPSNTISYGRASKRPTSTGGIASSAPLDVPYPHVSVKKPKLSPHESDTRPRPLKRIEMISCGELEDYAFFETVRATYPLLYIDILKCLNLFNLGIVSSAEVYELVAPILSTSPDLQARFQKILGLKQRILVKSPEEVDVDIDSYYKPSNSLDGEEYEDHIGKRMGPSYRLKTSTSEKRTSRQHSELGTKVINENYISLPSWSEDSTFVTSRKNPFEENLIRVDDERYEYDRVVENNQHALEFFQQLENKIKMMDPQERENWKLDDMFGCGSKVLPILAIKRVYGESASFFIHSLKQNPVETIPTISKRLKSKGEEWRETRKVYSKHWREVYEKNYSKSLDQLGAASKQADLKLLRSKAMLQELLDQTLRAERVLFPIRKMFPHMIFSYHDFRMFNTASELILHCVDRLNTISDGDRIKIKQLLTFFVPRLFGKGHSHLAGLTTDEVNSYKQNNIATRRDYSFDEVSKKGDRVILQQVMLHDKPDEMYTLSFLNEYWYYFFRSHLLLCDRLHQMYVATKKLHKERFSKNYPYQYQMNTYAESLGYTRRPLKFGEPKDYFARMCDMVKQLVDGRMDQNQFEDNMRLMYHAKAHPSYALEKIVLHTVKQLHNIATDENSLQCVDLFYEAVQLHMTGGLCATANTREDAEFLYQRVAEKLLIKEYTIKHIIYNKSLIVTFELIDDETCSSDSAEEILRSLRSSARIATLRGRSTKGSNKEDNDEAEGEDEDESEKNEREEAEDDRQAADEEMEVDHQEEILSAEELERRLKANPSFLKRCVRKVKNAAQKEFDLAGQHTDETEGTKSVDSMDETATDTHITDKSNTPQCSFNLGNYKQASFLLPRGSTHILVKNSLARARRIHKKVTQCKYAKFVNWYYPYYETHISTNREARFEEWLLKWDTTGFDFESRLQSRSAATATTTSDTNVASGQKSDESDKKVRRVTVDDVNTIPYRAYYRYYCKAKPD